MKYLDVIKNFENQEVFSLGEIRTAEPGFYRSRLNDWQDKGYIKKLLKNYYFFSDKSFDELALFRAANRIYRPSYISLQSALSYHGVIPEKPLSITCVTSLRTREFKTPLGRFSYRKVSEKYFSGYSVEGAGADAFMMATPEKALADLLYLSEGAVNDDYIDGLRLNMKNLKKLTSRDGLKSAAGMFKNRKIDAAIRRITGSW